MRELGACFLASPPSAVSLRRLTSTFGWVVSGFAQPDAYSSLDDDISDLGALTAHAEN